MKTYRVEALYDDGDGWSIDVPEIPGCGSGADTFAEVEEMAKEAISCHLDIPLAQVRVEVRAFTTGRQPEGVRVRPWKLLSGASMWWAAAVLTGHASPRGRKSVWSLWGRK